MTTQNTPQRSQSGPHDDQNPVDDPAENLAPGATAGAPQPQDDEQDEQRDDQERDSERGNREAAKYRRKLRDAQAEADSLRARLEQYEAVQFEEAAAHEGLKPAALTAAGYDFAALLDDAGNVDRAKVQQAAAETRARFGIEPQTPRGYVSSHGTGDPSAQSADTDQQWSNLLKGRS